MNKFFLWINFLIFPFSALRAEAIPEEEHPVVILGGGVGALTSAVYLARAGITPVVITGPTVGGTITQSHNVQNWPGELSISGMELGERVMKQAEQNGAILIQETVLSVDMSKRPFIITTQPVYGSKDQIKLYRAESVIIAMGATPNFLHIPGETGKEGHFSPGISNCAVCDGALYKGRVVAVVGGGDAALLEAEYLSNLAEKVHIFVRKDRFRTVEMERMKEVLARPNVEVHYKTTVKEVKGDGSKTTHVIVQEESTKKNSEIPVDGLFLAIGSHPNTDLLKNQLELDDQGYIVLKKHQQTSVEGVYAIGDICDPEFKQAISAAGDAAKAALQAQKYLASLGSAAKAAPLATLAKASEPQKPVEITSKEHFEREIREAKGVVFVDFYAAYCGPCRTFAPVYDTWAKEYGGKAKFLKISPDAGREIFEKYQIQAIPTLLVLDEHGNVLRKSVGFKEISEIEKRLKKSKEFVSPHDFK